MGLPANASPSLEYCCPTPKTPAGECNAANGCVTPEVCRAGPVIKSKYVAQIHAEVPDSYSYSYDDVVGLHACDRQNVGYRLEFCPAGSMTYPVKAKL